MMSLVAIDIALIPDEKTVDLCVELTKDAEKPLGKDDFLPHVTLFLGCIKEKDIPQVSEIVKQHQPVNITITEFKFSEEKKTYNFNIEKTPELLALHQKIVEKLRPFHIPKASTETLVEGDKTGLSESSQDWLNFFIDKSSEENYWPHITLRMKEDKPLNFPITSATTLGLFQVGDGCQCRRKL